MTRRFFLALFACLACSAAALAADWAELAKRLPTDINAVGLIDASALNSSDLGKESNWANKPEMTSLPANVAQIAVGGLFNPAAGIHDWRYGIAKLKNNIGASGIAKKLNGTVTTIANHSAVITPNNMALVELDNGLIAIQSSTNRQELSRWIKEADAASTLTLNPYLRDFIKENAAAQVRFGLDTGDLFDPAGVKRALANSKALGGDQAKIDEVARKIVAMKGMNFSIRVDSEIRGTLRVDFNTDASSLSSVALPLFQEVLREQGLWLADFAGWKAQVRGTQIYFTGKMTESGLRQAMTMLLAHQHSMQSMQPDEPQSPENTALKASKRYFNGCLNLIDDLRKEMKELRTTKEFAYWYEHTARKIDSLPSVNVDDSLLQYGGTISDKFRAMAASCRGQSIDVNKLMSYQRSSSTLSYSGGTGTAWGYNFGYATGGAYFNNNYADVAQQQAETVAQAANDRVKIWESIDQNTGQVRRAMSQKYQTDF